MGVIGNSANRFYPSYMFVKTKRFEVMKVSYIRKSFWY